MKLQSDSCGCPPCGGGGRVFMSDQIARANFNLVCLDSDGAEVPFFESYPPTYDGGVDDVTSGENKRWTSAACISVVHSGRIAYLVHNPLSGNAIMYVRDFSNPLDYVILPVFVADPSLQPVVPGCVYPYGDDWLVGVSNAEAAHLWLVNGTTGTKTLLATVTSAIGGGDRPCIRSIIVGTDGLIYFAGRFDSIAPASGGSASRMTVACVNASGALQSFAAPISTSQDIFAAVVFELAGGAIAIGVDFRAGLATSTEIQHTSGGSRYGFAAYDKATGALDAWNPSGSSSGGDSLLDCIANDAVLEGKMRPISVLMNLCEGVAGIEAFL